MTLTDTTKTGTGATNQGAMNKVVEQHYGTEQGAFSGFFKGEKGFDPTPAGHDVETGIRQADPNYGARAVAMTRIDQLLGTNLMVRTEFATSGGKLGTVGASAKGTRAVDSKFVLTDAERATNPGAVSLQDAVLQKALNQMQIIDAICGQLDRHAGNWFVEADAQGRVTGVSGMDLDMAFGKDLTDPDGKQARKAMHYRGMPQMVDADLAKRILLVEDDDIKTAVEGLLEKGEVDALVARFNVVKTKIQQIAKSGGLVKVWDASTAAKARPKGPQDMFDADKKTYQQNLTFDALEKIKKTSRPR